MGRRELLRLLMVGVLLIEDWWLSSYKAHALLA